MSSRRGLMLACAACSVVGGTVGAMLALSVRPAVAHQDRAPVELGPADALLLAAPRGAATDALALLSSALAAADQRLGPEDARVVAARNVRSEALLALGRAREALDEATWVIESSGRAVDWMQQSIALRHAAPGASAGAAPASRAAFWFTFSARAGAARASAAPMLGGFTAPRPSSAAMLRSSRSRRRAGATG